MTRDDSEETTEKERGLREEESDESVRVVRVERERERERERLFQCLTPQEYSIIITHHNTSVCFFYNALSDLFLSFSLLLLLLLRLALLPLERIFAARTPRLRRVRLHRGRLFLCRTTPKIPPVVVVHFRRPTSRAIVVSIDQPPRQVALSGRSNRFQRDFGRYYD